MYLELYPDVVFILNFLIDFILLLLLRAVNRRKSGILRLLPAAAAGAVAAVCVSLTPWLAGLAGDGRSQLLLKAALFLIEAGSLVLMLYIAFGRMSVLQLIKQSAGLFLLSCFAGGLMSSLYYYTDFRERMLDLGDHLILSNLSAGFVLPAMVAILGLGMGLAGWHRICGRKRRELYELELFLGDGSVKTAGLYDTGNCLYDPISHKPVIVVEDGVMEALMPEKFKKEFRGLQGYLHLEEAAATQEASVMERLRFIPYSSVGKANGMMPGLVLDKVLIHKGKETISHDKVTAAICDWRLSPGEEYHVILHKDFLL